jgi:DNA-binding MarR family transcriptional regulator
MKFQISCRNGASRLVRMSAQGDPEVARTRWLTADQLAQWRGFMMLVHRLPAALDSQLERDSQLSFIEYYVLAGLSDQPGHRMRMSELAALANSELSRLSHMVSRLEKRGFVRREPDPRSGRYTQAILTEAGYAYLAGAAPGHVRRVLDLFIDVLDPEELQTLLRCSDKVIAHIESTQEQRETTGAALS